MVLSPWKLLQHLLTSYIFEKLEAIRHDDQFPSSLPDIATLPSSFSQHLLGHLCHLTLCFYFLQHSPHLLNVSPEPSGFFLSWLLFLWLPTCSGTPNPKTSTQTKTPLPFFMSSKKINPCLLCPFVHISFIFRPLKFCFFSSSRCLPDCWIQWKAPHWISLSITWNCSLFGFSDTALPSFLSHLSDRGFCFFQGLRLLDWPFKSCFFLRGWHWTQLLLSVPEPVSYLILPTVLCMIFTFSHIQPKSLSSASDLSMQPSIGQTYLEIPQVSQISVCTFHCFISGGHMNCD